MTNPLTFHRSPAAGFDEPFEMLLACHERVQRMLGLLARLAEHLGAHGADEQARQAARDVMRYFDLAGPAHHEDEERHLFPLLLERADCHDVVLRLQRDHTEMGRQWALLRADLQAVAEGLLHDAAACWPRWAAYAALYEDHIRIEESLAYPAAQALLDVQARASMGREMAARRGLVI